MLMIIRYRQSVLTGIIAMVLMITAAGYAQTGNNNCIECHRDLDDAYENPVTLVENDIHFNRGIMCVDCHGGDSAIDPEGDPYAAMDPAQEYTGSVTRSEIPLFCDQCHGDTEYMGRFNPNLRVDQYRRYTTSIHGQRSAEGDENAAVCSDCHHVHQMRQINDPLSKVYALNVHETCNSCHGNDAYMEQYSISTDQTELYTSSVHYEYLTERGDLSASTCNDCHGNHGAVPPGFDTIHYVCGSCHAAVKNLFDKSAHAQAFRDSDLPECVTCHSNHNVQYTGEFMLEEVEGLCWDCHDAESPEGKVIKEITLEIETLKNLYSHADSLIALAEIKGMEVRDNKLDLIDLSSIITITSNLVHTLSVTRIREETDPGKELAQAIISGGNSAIAELNLRRTGLLVFLALILLFLAGLIFKIRSLPAPEQDK